MIPFTKSLKELMLITKSRDPVKTSSDNKDYNFLTEDSGQRKRYIRSKDYKKIDLPDLPKATRRKWRKSKEVVSKFFDELDYNNQIQSTYDITLMERQKNYRHKDAA